MKPHVAEPTAAPTPVVTTTPVARSLRAQAWLLAATHAIVDIFPMTITSLMIVLTNRLGLTSQQETIVWIATPIFSGMFQPLFA